MSEGARVESIDAIHIFKLALVKFIEGAGAALGDAESDVQRTLMWLENEQQVYWTGQIRQRQDALTKAQDALRQKKLFKDFSGNTPSAIEEMKMVAICQKRLQEAKEKLAKTKMHAKRLHKEALLYKGQVQRLQTNVSSEMPAAVAHLGALVQSLESYAALEMAGARSASQEAAAAFFQSTGASMGRGEGAALPRTFAELRRRTPSAPAREKITPGEKFPANWEAAVVSDSHRTAVEGLDVKEAPPLPSDKVVIANGSATGPAIFLERVSGALEGDSGWYIGPLEAGLDNAPFSFTIGDLLAARPDLVPVLALPPGFLVVINDKGIAAIINGKDEDLWTSAVKE